MFDLDLTEEHSLLEQSVREWAGREVAPRIRELDRAHRFDRNILPQMAALGLLGISVPTEYGGAGVGLNSPRPPGRGGVYLPNSAWRVHAGGGGGELCPPGSRGSPGAEQREPVPPRSG